MKQFTPEDTAAALRSVGAWLGSATGRGFILGLVVGGAAMAWFAPKSGVALRQSLKEKAQSGRDAVAGKLTKTADTARSLVDDAGALVDRGKERVQAQKVRLASAVEAARAAYAEHSPAS